MTDDDDRAVFDAFAEAGQPRKYPPGAALFLEGDPPGTLFAIRSGEVRVTARSDAEEATLTVCGPGQLLGEVSAIDGLPRSASAIAITEVEVAAVPAGQFNRMLEHQPELAMQIMRLLANRLRRLTGDRVVHRRGDAITRVASGVVEAASRAEPVGTALRVPVTAADLVAYVDGDYEVTSRALAGLAGEGWIEVHADGIDVLNLPALRRLSEDSAPPGW